ncbi:MULTISPECIES: hypothetical protein [Proteus]|uniref:hypothetical protein n=1 Tax=Proteus TaxID=583 RepID=UPI000D697627|nr:MULTISPECIES: hypothetical protein [Proteus]WIF71404.1 hypothetical protein QN092_15680 [Proteus vulgaris]
MMNNTKLKESACDELLYATSILNLIINDNVTPSDNMFNAIESAVANIERAKESVSNINTDKSPKPIGEIKISDNDTIETAVGCILNTLETAINLKVAEESGHIKNYDIQITNLIQSAKLNLETVYEKVSFTEAQ